MDEVQLILALHWWDRLKEVLEVLCFPQPCAHASCCHAAKLLLTEVTAQVPSLALPWAAGSAASAKSKHQEMFSPAWEWKKG